MAQPPVDFVLPLFPNRISTHVVLEQGHTTYVGRIFQLPPYNEYSCIINARKRDLRRWQCRIAPILYSTHDNSFFSTLYRVLGTLYVSTRLVSTNSICDTLYIYIEAISYLLHYSLWNLILA